MEPTTTVVSLGDASIIAGVTGLLLAFVFLVLWRRATDRVASAVEHSDPSSAALISSLVALADLSTSPAQRGQASKVLATVGVERIEVGPGDDFDAELHSAVGTELTDDAGLIGQVVYVARDGWSRGDELVRAAEVIVWVRGTKAPPVEP